MFDALIWAISVFFDNLYLVKYGCPPRKIGKLWEMSQMNGEIWVPPSKAFTPINVFELSLTTSKVCSFGVSIENY